MNESELILTANGMARPFELGELVWFEGPNKMELYGRVAEPPTPHSQITAIDVQGIGTYRASCSLVHRSTIKER